MSGKRYGFVRFVKMTEVDRLIENLCTIWMGRLRLHANFVRFQRPSLNYVRKDVGINVEKRPSHVKPWSSGFSGEPNSYAFAVKQGKLDKKVEEETKPVLVLDESCILERDFSLSLMGKLMDFDSISNIKKVLAVEGFKNIKISYMGGFWVMIEFQSVKSKEKFKSHVGVGSWFSEIIQASNSFHVDGRVTRGELLQEDQEDACFHSKRICIKTTLVEYIFESFKIIVKGKVYWVRAIEAGWDPDFVKEDEDENKTDDDNLEEGLNEVNDEFRKEKIVEDVTDDEEIPEIIFDQEDSDSSKKEPHCDGQDDAHSSGPFYLYDLLKKKKKLDDGNRDQRLEDTLKFPPGFTPKDDTNVYSKSLNKSEGEFEEGMNKVDSDVREKVSM
nr:hypothetical protein [Tanacetum cinerariifolium]